MLRRSIKRTTAVASVAALALVVTACERGDEDTVGGRTGEDDVTASATASPSATGATGSTSTATGSSGVSGSVGTTGEGQAVVTAVDYEFQLPATGELAADTTSLVLQNEGEEPHELTLLSLSDGRTLDDFNAYVEENGIGGQPPSWVGFAGGTFAKPGKTSEPVEIQLEPGTYVMACFVETEEGVPHAELGMLQELPVA